MTVADVNNLPTQPPFDDELVETFLKFPEGYAFDCKRLGKLDRVIEAVVAFANADGGTIALGLEDPNKGHGRDRVYGIQENPLALDELRRLVRSRITPEIDGLGFLEISCALRGGEPGSVCFLRVPKSPGVHSIVNDGTFRRLDRSNQQLTAHQVNELSFARGSISAESQCVEVDFELLDTNYWRQYASMRRLTRPLPEALRHIGLARTDHAGALRPTRAAVLLFAEDPAGPLGGKASVRVLHYKGERIQRGPTPNLLKPPKTIGGPLIRQIADTIDYLKNELATGVELGPLGFEVVHRYPVRVLREAVTNAVVHRDYHIPVDIQVRIFADRVEIESPGLLPGPVSQSNIWKMGSYNRNPLIVNALREFPDPPNLDAGEGVRMMFDTMWQSQLYLPVYLTRPQLDKDAVLVVTLNEQRPTVWDQVSNFIDNHGSITNKEVRQLTVTGDVLGASKQLREWVQKGLLVVVNAKAAKQHRRYSKPSTPPEAPLFSKLSGKQPSQTN
jgi:ATP-dependent DNA helicase RecG